MTYADPWVLQSIRGCDSLGRVDSQHAVDQVLGFGCHCVPFGRRVLGNVIVALGISPSRYLGHHQQMLHYT